jgi:soluble calcium-activated nucleotidase 1
MSPEPYDDVLDEKRGNNKGFLLSEDFSKLETITIGPQDPELGFSSFKYVPFRENEIVVLKTKEIGAENKTETCAFPTVTNIKNCMATS